MDMEHFQKMEKSILYKLIKIKKHQQHGVILLQMKSLEHVLQNLMEDILGIKIVD